MTNGQQQPGYAPRGSYGQNAQGMANGQQTGYMPQNGYGQASLGQNAQRMGHQQMSGQTSGYVPQDG